MNSPAVKPLAPSPHPALELIALAQLPPEEACQRLRELLLGNPHYFGNVPTTSFNAVLKIQEDTTYERLSGVVFDAQLEQLRATVDVKKRAGYSGPARINGSEEFVRFYVSHDGGANWLDQGVRSVTVSDAGLPRPLAYPVILQLGPSGKTVWLNLQVRVRAILSWGSPPPAGAANWRPIWGNVAESDAPFKDARPASEAVSRSDADDFFVGAKLITTDRAIQAEAGSFAVEMLPCSKTDPHHRFLAYLFARAAMHFSAEARRDLTAAEPSLCDLAVPAHTLPHTNQARFATSSVSW